ncbi:MAG: GTPase HflX [Oligoflexales bacterium]|nr:GTPase HflX [Oligoflexales bacterium]
MQSVIHHSQIPVSHTTTLAGELALSNEQSLDELEELLMTLGVKTVARIVQKRQHLEASTLLGSGKVEEIKKMAQELCVDYVVFDFKISGPQARNLQEIIGLQILDRAGVIIDIFAKHAKTKVAKIQVEIAQLEYQMPRLAHAWSHFGRQNGGGMLSRGMGEKQIEVDRRRARERLSQLKKKLKVIEEEHRTQSKRRRKEISVALIGYTNSGKTTLMSQLSSGHFAAEDALFATLDTSVRSLDPSTHPRILISDTVGFIKNLPHGLIASFKSTLAQAVEADLLLQVVDLSHPQFEDHIDVTTQVLQEIGAAEIPRLLVFNKIDRLSEQFLPKIIAKKYPHAIFLSAHDEVATKKMRQWIYDYFDEHFKAVDVHIDGNNHEIISYIYRWCHVNKVEYGDDGMVHFSLRGPKNAINKILNFKVNRSEEYLQFSV